jgi:hypothetical protein
MGAWWAVEGWAADYKPNLALALAQQALAAIEMRVIWRRTEPVRLGHVDGAMGHVSWCRGVDFFGGQHARPDPDADPDAVSMSGPR